MRVPWVDLATAHGTILVEQRPLTGAAGPAGVDRAARVAPLWVKEDPPHSSPTFPGGGGTDPPPTLARFTLKAHFNMDKNSSESEIW